jgi:hypothetical protein
VHPTTTAHNLKVAKLALKLCAFCVHENEFQLRFLGLRAYLAGPMFLPFGIVAACSRFWRCGAAIF